MWKAWERNLNTDLVEKHEGRIPIGSRKCCGGDDTNMDLDHIEMKWVGVDWIHLA
jgi:hypothetical protein